MGRCSVPELRFDTLVNVFLLSLTCQEIAGKYLNECPGEQLQRIQLRGFIDQRNTLDRR